MIPLDAEIIGLCVVWAVGGALLMLILLDLAGRKAIRKAYEEGRRDGFNAGRASLFPHRLGGDHG